MASKSKITVVVVSEFLLVLGGAIIGAGVELNKAKINPLIIAMVLLILGVIARFSAEGIK